MRRAVVDLAEAVYNFANPFVDRTWLSWPWYVIARSSGALADWLDPVAQRANGVSGS